MLPRCYHKPRVAGIKMQQDHSPLVNDTHRGLGGWIIRCSFGVAVVWYCQGTEGIQ